MDEATFERYIQAYLLSQGHDPRPAGELLDAATRAERQRVKAEKMLMNLWRTRTSSTQKVVPKPRA